MLERLKQQSAPWVEELARGLQQQPSVSVRLNPSKKPEELTDMLARRQVAWWPAGHYLAERPRFTLDPRLHQGRYYVQDASSMFIGHVIKHITDTAPVDYLDACAAPGGKTSCACDALPAGSRLTANEINTRRARILAENVAKWGHSPTVTVTSLDTARLHGAYDIITVDAPCSGEGMMRKDDEAVAQWSERLISECADRQRVILANLWPRLRPGGHLIYSTCTFNRDENEEILQWLVDECDAEPVAIPVEESWGIQPGVATDLPCYRFIPGIVDGEGLFMAVVKKPDDAPGPRRKEPANPVLELTDNERLQSQLLSTAYDHSLPEVEVDRDTALSFLAREALRLPEGTPRGRVCLTYDNLPLGAVNNLGNRANNLYPQDWRIRHLK